MLNRQIGLVGAGNMARALAGGLLSAGFDRERLRAFDPATQQRAAMERDFGIATESSNAGLAGKSDVLVLAVKPQEMRAAAAQIVPSLATRQPLVISVAAGVRIGALSSWLGGYSNVVRAMPNRPALLRKGATGLYAPPAVSRELRQVAELLLSAIGVTAWVDDEAHLDAVTAVSGSGPAYFYLLIEYLEDAGKELGLPDETARILAIETAYGAACMARERADTPRKLREQVTSPGGTTAAALKVLERADLRGIVSRAVAAACRRSAELAEESARQDGAA